MRSIEHLEHGLFLPLSPLFFSVLEFYNINLFQLLATSYSTLSAMAIIYSKIGYQDISPVEINYMFNLLESKSFGEFPMYTLKFVKQSLLKNPFIKIIPR